MSLDAALASKRLRELYSLWKENRESDDGFGGCDAIVLARGKDNEDETYSKSKSAQTWLFGYELPDVAIVLAEKKIVCIASKKKVEFLTPLTKVEVGDGGEALPPIELLQRNKADNDADNFAKATAAIKVSYGGKTVGVFTKDVDKMTGPFFTSGVSPMLKSFELVNVAGPVATLLATKSVAEIEHLKGAARLSSDVMSKKLKNFILDVVDEENTKTSHEQLSEKAEAFINEPADDKAKYADKLRLDRQQLESCYTPIVQSGGAYNLKASATSDDSPVKWPGAIVCSLGARYMQHCSNISRTLIVEASPEQEKNYKFLLSLHEAALEQMRPGKPISGVYAAVVDKVAKERPDLMPHLTKAAGFGMSVEFRDAALILNAKCPYEFRPNTAFNLSIGFDRLKGPDGEPYALLVADTVLVREETAEVLTPMSKAWDDVNFTFKDEDDEEDAAADKEKEERLAKLLAAQSGSRRREGDDADEEGKRKTLAELTRNADEEAKARLLKQNDKRLAKAKKAGMVEAYKDRSHMSGEECRKMRIFFDKRKEAVILPIFGFPVPFHISVIKNCTKIDEENASVMRINFDIPGVTLKPEYLARGEGLIYLKEITFRSEQVAGLTNAQRHIKEMLKKYRAGLADAKQLENYVEQDAIQLNPKGAHTPQLANLFVRPSAEKKRVQGTLEAHKNGFLYTSRRGERIKILYNNVKYAFFQPPDNDIVILLHFHLRNGLMIGKKQHKEIQFYVEVGEVSTDLGKRASAHERDEVEAEHREKVMRSKTKKMFKAFMEKVTKHLEVVSEDGAPWEFEEPFTDLGFYGVPGKESTFCSPTTNCLVSLTCQPPFVLPLENVERVHFERIHFQLKNFDMVFIPKDYTQPVTEIKTIETKAFDGIKEWLEQCELPYTAGSTNLNWKKIMKTIVDDPEGFFAEDGAGGWTGVLGGGDDEDEGDEGAESDESEGFQVDSDELQESDSEYEDSEDDMSSEEDDSGSEASLDSNESEGQDWDELEAKAAADDRRRGREEEAAPVKRKAKGGGGAASRKKPRF